MSPTTPAGAATRSWIATVATLAAFALFAWVLAVVVLRALEPVSPPPPPGAERDPATAIIASGLWAGPPGEVSAPASPVAPQSGEFTLVGILAEREGRGWGVFRTRDGTRVVPAGADIVAGATLVAVDAYAVRVREGAGERTVELRREAAPAPRRESAPRGAGRPASPACAIPAAYAGALLKLHGELVEGLIAQPEAWRALFASDGGSLVVREEGGFAAMLGLARGDRLVQSNGVALREVDDLVATVLRPLVAGQPVRIVGQRAGRAREMLVQNAGLCP
ncbi:MAG: hypothetical protein IT520_16830 [Burkholderiales bacterium]|nr:hypothetical protein [Burkholderiales bacterium]